MEMQQIIHRLRELNDTLSASSGNNELAFAEALQGFLFLTWSQKAWQPQEGKHPSCG